MFTIRKFRKKKFREILRYFCLDIEAVKVAEICEISTKLSGEIGIDESYFGAKSWSLSIW